MKSHIQSEKEKRNPNQIPTKILLLQLSNGLDEINAHAGIYIEFGVELGARLRVIQSRKVFRFVGK